MTTHLNPNLDPKNPRKSPVPLDFARMYTDARYRKACAERMHELFFSMYLPHHAQIAPAPLHKALFEMTQSEDPYGLVQAFRGSGKSTISTFSYPMWAILGMQRKRFVVIVSANKDLAQRHLDNIKREFEENARLRNDFGVIHEEESPWNSSALTFRAYGAMIAAISVDQSMRGIRFRHMRPDVMIIDDAEDRKVMKTQEGRDKVFNTIMSDFIPAGSDSKKIIIIGSNLHADSPINRMKEYLQEHSELGRVHFFPIVDAHGASAWPAKYPDASAIEKLRISIPDALAWHTEYLLDPIAPDDQIIQADHIQYYTPEASPDLRTGVIVIGVDPAIKKGPHNDYTGIVPVFIGGSKKAPQYYVLNDIIKKRLNVSESAAAIQAMVTKYRHYTCHVVVEDIGFQSALIEQLKRIGCRRVSEFKPSGRSKTERLYSVSPMFTEKRIWFPDTGAEDLVHQILGHGVEKYDDLQDALTAAMLGAQESNIRPASGGIIMLDGKGGAEAHFINNPNDPERPKQPPHSVPIPKEKEKRKNAICYSQEEQDAHLSVYAADFKKKEGRLPANLGPFGFLRF